MRSTDPESTDPPTRPNARRRGRSIWSLAVVLSLALVAAACGGNDDDTGNAASADAASANERTGGTSDTGAVDDIDPDGVLRLGTQLTIPAGNHLDPTKSAVNPDRQRMELVFGTLLRNTADGQVEAWMAESFEIVDPQTVTLTLRDGVLFTDGTPYDAEAVRAGLLRTLIEATDVAAPSLSVAFKAITDITTDGNLVTITLSSPQAGELVAALADREGAIVAPSQVASAPDQIDTDPVGAGPYVVEEFINGQLISLRKNPDFWDADSWKLGGIDFVQTGDGAAQVNGLLSDTIDFAHRVPTTEAVRLENDPNFVVESLVNDRSYQFINLCTGKPPFDDADVRRAIQIGIDRDEVSELVYGGAAEAALGFWPEGDPYYNPAVDKIVGYDPERAEQLLAGREVPLDLYTTPSPESQRVAEVLQAQLGKIGVDVTVHNPRDLVSEFIAPQKPGGMLIPGSRTGVDKYARVFAEGQVQALCGQPRPEVVDTVAPASALLPGDDEAAALFQEAELMIAEGAYIIPIVYTPNLMTWSDQRVGGETQFYATNADPMLDTFYMKR